MKSAYSLLACAGAASAQSLASVLTGTNATSGLATLVQTVPGLLDVLSGLKNITIFAPSNDALSNFTAANSAAVQADSGLVQAVLKYHVLNGTFDAASILNATGPLFPRSILSDDKYENVDGAQYLKVQAENGAVQVITGLENNSTVTTADVKFDNGIIHVINKVLTIPENVTATATAANLTSLAGALIAADLLDAVNKASNVTIFAPSNQAFESIGSAVANISKETLTSVLEYHVVNGSVTFSTELSDNLTVSTLSGAKLTFHKSGDNFFVNGALIAQPNVLVNNGVVHVIDQVLNPGNATATPSASATAGAVQYSGVTAATSAVLTSGVPTAATTISSRSTGTAASASTTKASSSSSSAGAAATAMNLGPVAGAILAGAAFLV